MPRHNLKTEFLHEPFKYEKYQNNVEIIVLLFCGALKPEHT